jgi:hypothetical protein
MNYFSKTILALAAAASIAAPGVQASPYEMTGSILVSGSVAFNTGSSGTATQVMGWYGDNGSGSALVQGGNGNFGNYTGAAAHSGAPWNFASAPGYLDPFTAPPSLTNFLSVGGMTFYLTDWNIQSQVLNNAFDGKNAPGALTIAGRGYVSGPDFLTTFGTWIFSTVDADGLNKATFSFHANADGTNLLVPEGGTTVALLGLAITALALVRRRLQAAEQKRAVSRA